MDRYALFQMLLTMLADDYEITNATMRDYCGNISIEATCSDNDIKLEVSIKGKEAADA